MRHFAPFLLIFALLMSSPALAQSSRTLPRCTQSQLLEGIDLYTEYLEQLNIFTIMMDEGRPNKEILAQAQMMFNHLSLEVYPEVPFCYELINFHYAITINAAHAAMTQAMFLANETELTDIQLDLTTDFTGMQREAISELTGN